MTSNNNPAPPSYFQNNDLEANKNYNKQPANESYVHNPPQQPFYILGGNKGAENDYALAYLQRRNGFLRKVYGVLSLQLIFSFGITLLFSYSDSTKEWVQNHPWAYYSSYMIVFATLIFLICLPHLFRTRSAQAVLLVVFTGAFSYMVGTIASFYDSNAVWQAIVTALLITVGLTLLTFQLKVDLTKYWGALFAVSLGFIIFGLIRLFFPDDPVVDTVYAAIGAILFSVYIVFDTQFMLKYMDDDDYLLAALNLYADVMNLFLMLLSLLGDN
eukprot:TRINITY_DN2243_c0_g1_i1.p1 TRINITY_DN2243_c0_g1~~TRINITY_DN2243_c0_g1_i1.p1  ORF type:complete len:272 (-),score=67.60 TRINITY_DN2243_c0_g1_i1:1488-2303(-)